MKNKKEIAKKAKELCNRDDAECAVFISGYVRGYQDCQKEMEEKNSNE